MLTKQEIIDKVWAGFVAQNWQMCYDANNDTCLYNGPNNTHCAWGMIDPSAPEGGKASRTPLFHTFCDDAEWGNELQLAHDYAATAIAQLAIDVDAAKKYDFKYGELQNNIRKFAKYHGLIVPE